MKNINYFAISLLLFGHVAGAQTLVQGRVINTNNDPVAFVNIGIVQKGIGTVSDLHGMFSITIPEELKKEKLRFSHIGYTSLDIPISKIKGNVILTDAVTQLSPVEISALALQEKLIGNKSKAGFLISGFSVNDLGGEVGSRFNIKKPSFIEQLGFNIKHNSFDSLTLRVNVYTINNKLPDGKISKEEYIKIYGKQKALFLINCYMSFLLMKML